MKFPSRKGSAVLIGSMAFGILALMPLVSVSAENAPTSTPPNRPQKIEALKVNIEARKKAVEVRRVELKAQIDRQKAVRKEENLKRLDAKAKERVAEKIRGIYRGLEERIARLTKVDAELAARITKISGTGVNVSTVTPLMTAAQTAFAKAKTDVEATKTALIAETATATSKESIRALVKTAEDSIKAAGEAYKKVMDALKILPKPNI
jgi:hypothetical protein